MCRVLSISVFLVGMAAAWPAFAQEAIRFNKTAHDFGEVVPGSRIEYDFIFRNVSETPFTVERATTQGIGLEVIHTRSEVLPGEYGFIKVKWLAPDNAHIANSLITVAFRSNKSTWQSELYMRLETSTSAMAGDSKREFKDSEIATSVQVTAADIEGLEGFRGNDALSSAEAEINYLKKQLDIKTNLILKLASDIDEKQQSEEESLQKLAQLQQTIEAWANGKADQGQALQQVQSLGSALDQWKSTDSLWRMDIVQQEQALQRLQREADSARAHANALSQQLAEKFANEARALEKAARLEKELAARMATENRQKQEIDSLQQKMAEQSMKQEQWLKTKEDLEAELEWKLKEQQLQTAHTRHQHEKIEALKKENKKIKLHADSLNGYVLATSKETDSLQKALTASDYRLRSYSSLIDSLTLASRLHPANETEATAAIDSLQQLLSQANETDAALKQEIARQNTLLADLQSQKAKTEKRVLFLQQELNDQSAEAMQLLQRMNRIATNESQARLEVEALKKELASKQQQADSAMAVISDLKATMQNGTATNLEEELALAQKNVAETSASTQGLQEKLTEQEKLLTANAHSNDSLHNLVKDLQKRREQTEDELAQVKKQSSGAEEQLRQALAEAKDLQKLLENARLSNQFAFEEMKEETESMRRERDETLSENKALLKKIALLEQELSEAEKGKLMASAFAEEMKTMAVEGQMPDHIVYKVQVLQSDTDIASSDPRLKKLPKLSSFYDRGTFHYTVGEEPDFKSALKLKKQMQDSGFEYPMVLAFRDGKQIPLKEALEMVN